MNAGDGIPQLRCEFGNSLIFHSLVSGMENLDGATIWGSKNTAEKVQLVSMEGGLLVRCIEFPGVDGNTASSSAGLGLSIKA